MWLTLGMGGSLAVAESVSESDIERRLAFIEERLDARQPHTEIWQGVWTGINGGATVALAAFVVAVVVAAATTTTAAAMAAARGAVAAPTGGVFTAVIIQKAYSRCE